MKDARGYFGILHNPQFLRLWLAQIQSLLSLNSLLFVTIVLIEKATQSTVQTAAVIAAFSLPAVFLAPVAGIVVDRVSKKDLLVISNALRVFSQALLALVAWLGTNGWIPLPLFISLIYFLIFLNSSIGQFFAPAEGAMIPLLVGRSGLFAANSLFTLTVIGIQVLALVAFVPLAIKTLGAVMTQALLVVFYVGATVLLMTLPRDSVPSRRALGAGNVTRHAWAEIVEGWHYTLRHKSVLIGVLQFALVGVLVFVLATLAPGYASRVLGTSAEDAIYVFAPAGLGMLIASGFVVRFGPHFGRQVLPIAGMVLMGLSLLGMGLVGQANTGALFTLLVITTETLGGITAFAGVCAFFGGVAMAMMLIPAQTVVQEESTDEVRGRVLTVQFTLANGLGVIPLMFIGGLADVIGISQMAALVGLSLLMLALLNYVYARQLTKRPLKHEPAQPLPLPGTDATTVRVEEDSNGRTPVKQAVVQEPPRR